MIVLSLRCQPWSFLNRYGSSQLPGALSERAAVYRSLRQMDPIVIFDEMLSRARLGGLMYAWRHAEYLRQLYLPSYRWVVCDTDPGDGPEAWTKSRREIVVLVRDDVLPLLRMWLETRGWREVTGPRAWCLLPLRR